jgi:hypothetical protein
VLLGINDIMPAIAAMDADAISIETTRSRMELLDAFVPAQAGAANRPRAVAANHGRHPPLVSGADAERCQSTLTVLRPGSKLMIAMVLHAEASTELRGNSVRREPIPKLPAQL